MIAETNPVLRWFTPTSNIDARLRIEQLRGVARNCRFLLLDPIFVVILVIIDAQWVPLKTMMPWAAMVLAGVALAVGGSQLLFRRERSPEEAAKLTLIMLAFVLPLNFLWLGMVPVAWVDGNILNNAFLITFLFASLAVGIAIFSASPHIAAPGLVFAQILLTTHGIHAQTREDWLSAPLQTLCGFIFFGLASVFHSIFRSAVLQRLEKEELAAHLERTASELARARDAAEQASAAKSTFLANMSHELRTPLNAIIGFTDIIREGVWGPLSPPRYGEYIEDVNRSGRHLLALINDILDLAKIEAGRRELEEREIDLSVLAAQAIEFVRPQAQIAKVSVRTEIDPTHSVIADERAMLQILVNLLSNAVKFSRPGGEAVIFARLTRDGGLAVGVEDDGIGMSAAGLKKALEPFGQAAPTITVEGRGTGLGLPLVKALVEAHGAAFRVESEIGTGTKVWGEFTRTCAMERRVIA